MNKVILSGNLCQNLGLKYTTSNISVCQNTIAVKNDFKNNNGEYESQFINFVAYRNNAEYLCKYANKGSKVLVEGKLQTRSYDDKDGNKRYVTEVIVDKVEVLDGRRKEEKAEPQKEETNEDPFAEFNNSVRVDQVSIDDNFLD